MEVILMRFENLPSEQAQFEIVAKATSLYHSVIHSIDPSIYSREEQQAWSPEPPEISEWIIRFQKAPPIFAILDTEAPSEPTAINQPSIDSKNLVSNPLVGFMNLELQSSLDPGPVGHVDLAYVSTEYQRMGISSKLYGEIEKKALDLGLKKLTVDASHLARPFFEKKGFRLVTENQVPRNGLLITNFSLEKDLIPRGQKAKSEV